MEMFDTFSDYLKQTIQASPEWQASQSRAQQGKPANDGFDDLDSDIPF